jgi:hypothetical protein
MKMAAKLFLWGGAFYLVVAGIYFFMSHDEVGTTGLVLTSGLSSMIGFYLLVTANRLPDQPEEVPTAEIWHAEPEYGHFSPYSWAPLLVALGAAFTFAGLAFAAWIVAGGLVLVVLATVYWVFEYYRGAARQF